MRWGLILFVIPILLATPVKASTEVLITMDEDSTFQSEITLNEILGLNNETKIEISTINENVTATMINGYVNITTHSNWNGFFLISYIYNQTGNITEGSFRINVTPVNDDPLIENITLSGDPSSLVNPVTYSVSYSDIDGDSITIKWYLDEEEIGGEDQGQRYIYPDQNNLTVVIDDGNGGTDSRTLVINTIPPEGWEDESDNTKNRVIFWIIFGTAGIILLAAMVWVLFRPESKEGKETPSQKENNAQNLPKNRS